MMTTQNDVNHVRLFKLTYFERALVYLPTDA